MNLNPAAIAAATIEHPVRNRYFLVADLWLIAMSAWGAYALRFDWLFVLYRVEFPVFLGSVLILKPIAFYAFGLYSRLWRYASLWDLIAVVFASSVATMVLTVLMAVLVILDYMGEGFPRTVLPIDWLLTTTVIGGLRMSVRVLAEMGRAPHGAARPLARRVLVVGAGNAGVLVVREMQRNPHLGLTPVGFVDDARGKQNKVILGVKVLGPLDAVARCAEECGADEVVIAIPTAPGTVIRNVVHRCREAGLPSRVIPGVFELLDGKVSINRLRDVDISDLLRRSQVPLAEAGIDYVRRRSVLVTGAGGSIGSELCRQVARNLPAHLVLLGHGENSIFDIQSQLREAFPHVDIKAVIADVRDRARLEQVFAETRPEVVFHAAAHKHVPLMEHNPVEAITNNVFGTRNVVECAAAHAVERLVMISTDKAVAPSSLMGASKRLAEMLVRRAARVHGRRYAVVRFGNVLGSRGSVVPLFKAQIERGGPLTVTHPEMRRFFMTIPEAVHLVLEAGGGTAGGELFVLNMGEPVRIVDLAEDLVELSGFRRGEIPIEFSGMRPGEKLDEQLWEDDAQVTPTASGDILRVFEQQDVHADLDAGIARLERAAQAADPLEIQRCLAELLPTFVPMLPESNRNYFPSRQ